jgi:alkylhydroperoxidase family enzyme
VEPQPLLSRVPPEKLDDSLRAARERALALRGNATFIEVAANAPHMFDWYARFYSEVFYGGRVPVRFKELLRLRLSTLHGCAFCNRGNRVDAALYAELRPHFDGGQIFELGMTMAVLTGMAKFLFTFDLVEREDYCEFGP